MLVTAAMNMWLQNVWFKALWVVNIDRNIAKQAQDIELPKSEAK